jgi:hypothetical protein
MDNAGSLPSRHHYLKSKSEKIDGSGQSTVFIRFGYNCLSEFVRAFAAEGLASCSVAELMSSSTPADDFRDAALLISDEMVRSREPKTTRRPIRPAFPSWAKV